VTRAQDFDDADLAATFPQVGDGKGLRGAMANGRYVLAGTAAGQAEDIVAEARREPFDLFVADQLAVGTALAGEVLGTPWVAVAVTPLSFMSRDLPPAGLRLLPATGRLGRVRDAVLRRIVGMAYQRLLTPMVNNVRAAIGLGPAADSGPDTFYSPYLVLAQGVPGLEYPRSDLPSEVHYVGRLAPADASRAAVPLPDWWSELAYPLAGCGCGAGRPRRSRMVSFVGTEPDVRQFRHRFADQPCANVRETSATC
jgi:hypothetical protein